MSQPHPDPNPSPIEEETKLPEPKNLGSLESS